MFIQHQDFSPDLLALIGAAEVSIRRVAPLFPLDRAVAVNPFHGMRDEPMAKVAARLERSAGLSIFPARADHAARIDAGEITEAHIEVALGEIAPGTDLSLDAVLSAARDTAQAARAIPTIADLCRDATGTDWPGLVIERIGAWAQGHFDAGQALWSAGEGAGVWAGWRDWAMRDLTPEILGLKGFAATVAETQQTHWRALGDACVALGIDHAAAPSVFDRLLADLGGWAGLGRYHLWQAELGGARDTTLAELLTVRLVWEQALHAAHGPEIAAAWDDALRAHGQPVVPRTDHLVDTVLLRASEIAVAQKLDAHLATATATAPETAAQAQLVFCIDVRSERMRRAIESVAPGIRTHGAAGFFGVPLTHREATFQDGVARAPVILAPALVAEDRHPDATGARIRGRVDRAVARFSRAAVSSFAFVEAAGPLRLASLVRASLGLAAKPAEGCSPHLTLDPDSDAAIDTAEGALRTMGLVADFAPVVAFIGHGARVTNDAQASLLQCGACGGHDGSANARALAALLNEPPVRRGLAARGVTIPETTVFMAGLHDTTSDSVSIFEGDAHTAVPDTLANALLAAGDLVRAERAITFGDAPTPEALRTRGADWSQTRAEWGLANCHYFIAAPRAATSGLTLDGRSFLNDYDASDDADGSWLAGILSGPVLVAAWINLQYYGATVAPDAFGGGNKLLQNVVGGFGVIDGVSGRLRGGPSEQSLREGTRAVHRPLRLAVRVAAPPEIVEAALSQSPDVRTMVENGWIDLKAMPAA